jgi:hypothetical protein
MAYAGRTFEYRRLGDIAYHVLADPAAIRELLLQWILPEWESDHREAPHEIWTVEWMERLPRMTFTLAALDLASIRPRADLMRAPGFRASLEQRADERDQAVLRGVSIEPLLVDRQGLELMDGYTRYTVLHRRRQKQVYAYIGGKS